MPGREQKLSRCLSSLALPEPENWGELRILLLDQGADAHPTDILSTLEQHYRGDRYWLYGSAPNMNLGVAGGRAHQIEFFRDVGTFQDDDLFIFLDDDLYASDSSWFSTLIAPILEDRADITGAEGRLVTNQYMTIPAIGEMCDYVSGGWCAISGRVFNAGVQFDTTFHPYGWEDVDLCYQAREKGFRVRAVEGVALVHEPHPGDITHFRANQARFKAKWRVSGERR